MYLFVKQLIQVPLKIILISLFVILRLNRSDLYCYVKVIGQPSNVRIQSFYQRSFGYHRYLPSKIISLQVFMLFIVLLVFYSAFPLVCLALSLSKNHKCFWIILKINFFNNNISYNWVATESFSKWFCRRNSATLQK